MTIQHIYNRKDVFVWLLTYAASPLLHVYEFLSFVFMPRIHFGKQTIITGLEATVLYGVQWDPSNTDTLGPLQCVLIGGVSSFQGANNTYLHEVGTWSVS